MGKTSAARILAKCLNCDHGPTPEPCNRCPSCEEITASRSLDVYEIDGASNTSVDDIRELRENIKYMSRPGKRKIYIIDEVHMLSKSAFNALLKTLEEPPEHVVFIFATTEPHKVPDTIQSRCQRYDFKRIPQRKIQDRIREITADEAITISDQALSWIAKAADGSMRDAQSLLDQMISYCGHEVSDEAAAEILGIAGRELFMRISGAILNQDPGGCVRAIDDVYQYGYDLTQFYKDLVDHFRDLLMARIMPKASDVLDVPDSHADELKHQVQECSVEDLQRMLSILMEAEGDILRSSMPRVGLEVTLIKMARLSRLKPLVQILERLEAMARKIPHPDTPGPPAPSPSPPRGEKAGRDAKGTAPSKQPAAQPAPVTDPSDKWEQFVQAVAQQRAVLGAQLENVISWELSPHALKVFCAEGSFMYEKLRQPDVKELLTRYVKEYFGDDRVFLACPAAATDPMQSTSSADKVAIPGNESSAQTSEQALPSDEEEAKMIPAVKAAIEVFGGTITEVKRLDQKRKP